MKMICTRACVLKGRGPCDKGDVVDVAPDRADEVFVKDHFRSAEVPPPQADVPPPTAKASDEKLNKGRVKAVNATDLPFMKGN